MSDITTADLFSVETIRDLVTEPMFARSVVLDSGLTRITTSSTHTYIPRVGGGTAAWHDELEELTDAAVEASEIPVIPMKVGCLQLVSNESANDAQAATIIGRALVAALADRVDHAFFVGDGPKGPSGLPGAGSAVVSVDAAPGAGLDAYIDAVALVESVGGEASTVFMHPSTWAALSKVKTTAGSTQTTLNAQPTQAGERSLLGLDVRTSHHCAVDSAYVLDASRVIVVDRQPGSVVVDHSAAFTRDGTYVRAIQRLEFCFPEDGVIAQIHDTP